MLDQEDLSNLQAELLFLLRANPPHWGRLEEIFGIMGAQAPKDLVIALAKRVLVGWSVGPESTTPPDIACVVSYAALGCEMKVEHKTRLGALLQRRETDKPFFPKPLDWSTHALLTLDPSASMDSPLVTAWIYSQDDTPREVILCGRGAGWIREELDYAILVASMARGPKENDIMVEGFSRLILDQAEMKVVSSVPNSLQALIGQAMGSTKMAQFYLESNTPASVFSKLINRLEHLSKTTGMVTVNHRPYSQRTEFANALDEKSVEAARQTDPEVHIWQPNQANDRRVIIPTPIPELALVLSYEFVENPYYQEIHDLYQNGTIRVAAVDALRRINFYTGQLSMHTESLRAYQDPKTRPTLPNPIILTHNIDYETGLMYRLNPPDRVPRDEYYGINVPKMVKLDIEWTEKMRNLLKDIAQAVGNSDSGLNRQTMTRLFDAAMRDLPLHADQDVQNSYQVWKTQIQPMLWNLWQDKLAEAGLLPEQLSTRQLIFNLNVDPATKTIRMLPHILTDSLTSCICFDSQHHWIPLVESLYDHIEEKQFAPQPSEAIRQYEDWHSKVLQYGDSASSTEMLRRALATDPQSVTARILRDCSIPQQKISDVEQQVEDVARKVGLVYSYDLALRMWSHNAYHSAIAVLEEIERHFEQLDRSSPFYNMVDIPFTLAYFKAMSEFGSEMIQNMTNLLRLKPPKNTAEREIQRLIVLANKRDHGYVEKSLKKESPLRSEAWFQAQNFSFLSEEEKIHLNTLKSMAYLQVSEQFAGGIDQFEVTGESPRSIYAKIGPAIQSAWAARFIEDSSEQLEDLFKLLLGEELKLRGS